MMLEIICHACPETGCAPRDRARMESAVESAEEEFSPHQVRDHLPCRALMMSTIRLILLILYIDLLLILLILYIDLFRSCNLEF